MNKRAYRLVFNKHRKMLMAVAEFVAGHLRGSTPKNASPYPPKEAPTFLVLPLRPLALSACLIIGSAARLAHAQALPTGGVVVGGAASIAQPSANQMLITQSTSKAAINWQSFNVGAGNGVQFVQPSSTSQMLNRVVGLSGPSQILGSLTANGQIFIVNTQGIVFGNGAMVNVGSLLAATKDISPSAFMAGGPLNFNGTSSGLGLIDNAGSLHANAGYIVLAADQVRNTGSIRAPGGQIVLAAGDLATVSLSNGQLVQLTLGANTNHASLNSSGLIQADGGKILLTTNATNSLLNSVINLSGVVEAAGGTIELTAGPIGNITLSGATLNVTGVGRAGGNVTLAGRYIDVLSNSSILASGDLGGGTVILAGNGSQANSQLTFANSVINVSGSSAGAAGGTVILSGNRVGLFGNSTIDASGVAGGGKIIIGGDQLKMVTNVSPVTLANQTYIDTNVLMKVGSAQGDGGFVETSGQQLTMLGNVLATGAKKHGAWLIDPTDINITTGTSTATNNTNYWNSTLSSAIVNNASITYALLTGANVTVTTAGGGAGTGNLNVLADINTTGGWMGGGSSLTLYANNNLTISNAMVGSALGAGVFNLNATAGGG